MSQALKLGDPVVYEGRVNYFQPNGSSCYLYDRPEDVGDKSKKRGSPSKTSVRKARPEELHQRGGGATRAQQEAQAQRAAHEERLRR